MNYFWNELETYGNDVALISDRETVSYEKLCHIAYEISKNIPERSLVFLVCKNEIASVAGYISFLRKRIVVALVSSTLDNNLFEKLLIIYKPQYIWCPNEYINNKGIYYYEDYKLVKTNNSFIKIYDDLAILMSTSGSTGSPKFVRLSYKNIQSNTESKINFLEIKKSDKSITSLPMNYIYGLSIINSQLMAGASVILTTYNILDNKFWDIFNKYGVTTFGAVPYTYQMLDKLNFLNYDLPSLRYITQSGGHLNEILHYKFAKVMKKSNKKFIVTYGATEAAATMSYLPFSMTLEKTGSIGIAIKGGRFELIDFDGNIILDNDTIGELVYYGPNVMLGYAQNIDDLKNGDDNHGRLVTGDLAKRDNDGYYYIVGRKSRFVKIFGHRISLNDIESLLIEKGYDVACTGDDDLINVYTTSNESNEIISFLSHTMHIDASAFKVIVISQIPRNQFGKTLYFEL